MPSVHTEQMPPRKSLHAGRSLWADSVTASLKLSTHVPGRIVDVAIIGGGITGAISALVLSAAGHEVAVIDRRHPGDGSTVASTAMIQFELDTPLVELASQIGEARAARAYRRSLRAVRSLADIIAEHRLDAALVERDALYIAGNAIDWRGLQSEAAARRTIGMPSRFMPKAEARERFGIETPGAILSAGSAEIDPLRTSVSALATAQSLGANIISPMEVKSIATSGGVVTLSLETGESLRCRKLICATGYEVVDGIPRDKFRMVSSWAIATKPISPASFWPTRCLIWEAADPYLYLRSTQDDRIVVGGEDEALQDPERRSAAIPSKAATLLRKVSRLLERDDIEIDYAWGGSFANSPTGLPVLRELDGLPGVFAILGCGGNGITFSVIASDIVKAWVRGVKDEDADIFAGE